MRFFGDVSSASDPLRYVACATSLLPHADAPLVVVNTPGWIRVRCAALPGAALLMMAMGPQGLGIDVLVEMLRALPTTHIVQLQTPNPNKNLPTDDFW